MTLGSLPEWVPPLPLRSLTGHKGTAGRLLIVGASPGLTGAVIMAQAAALRVGAGLVTCAVPQGVAPILESRTTEAMTLALPESESGTIASPAIEVLVESIRASQAVLIGPGLGRHFDTSQFVRSLCVECGDANVPFVVDADAIHALSTRALNPLLSEEWNGANMILTPHPGEFVRLDQALRDDRPDSGAFSRLPEAVWAIKGPGAGENIRSALEACPARIPFQPNAENVDVNRGNWVVEPDRPPLHCVTGNPGLATGGSGDVLAGIIASYVAQGVDRSKAVRLGYWLQGRAADLAAYGSAAQSPPATGRPTHWPPLAAQFASDQLGLGENSLLPSDVIDALPRAVVELQCIHDASTDPGQKRQSS